MTSGASSTSECLRTTVRGFDGTWCDVCRTDRAGILVSPSSTRSGLAQCRVVACRLAFPPCTWDIPARTATVSISTAAAFPFDTYGWYPGPSAEYQGGRQKMTPPIERKAVH